MALDLTEPQREELRSLVGSITERHIDRIVKRMWLSVITLGVIILMQGFYIAYVSGTKVNEIDSDHVALMTLQNARVTDEASLSALAATQTEMNQNLIQISEQLSRIEGHMKP